MPREAVFKFQSFIMRRHHVLEVVGFCVLGGMLQGTAFSVRPRVKGSIAGFLRSG